MLKVLPQGPILTLVTTSQTIISYEEGSMGKAAQNTAIDDRQSLESLDEVEESVAGKKGSSMQNVAPINSAANSSLQLEGLDISSDGKLKVCFTQGVELVVDPNNKVFQGRGVSLRVGNCQATISRNSDGMQVVVDGIVINLKR